MDWFRWHHGSVSDPKFQLVARRADASVAEVLAVWAVILERASAAEDRGSIGMIDHEAVDCALGLTDGKTLAIERCMAERGLIDLDEARVASWEKRQIKRERTGEDNSAERVRAFRERQKAGGGETACNATQRQETTRGEEKREEEKVVPASAGTSPGKPDVARPACPHGEVIALYHELLPALPRVVGSRWSGGKAEEALRSRWREGFASSKGFWSFKTRDEGLSKFREFFATLSDSDFLCGRVPGKNFRPDLHWILNRSNFDKILSDRYANAEAA